MSHPSEAPPAARHGDVVLHQAPGLAAIPNVAHGFTDRTGGVSGGDFASLNVSTRTGDARACVTANRNRILERLGRSDAAWVSLKQVHGKDVVQVTRSVGPNIAADALWTRDPGAVLATLAADCLPVLMTDTAGLVIGAAHAGWRGTAAGVPGELARRLQSGGTPAQTLVAALGPAIGPCCYEVDTEVAQALTAVCSEPQAVAARGDGKYMVDLWHINRHTLIEAGVPAESIDVIRLCTRCDARFFSHRRDRGITGRQAGVIAFV